MSTAIPYVDQVWDPVTGCSPISPACRHCWARKIITTRLRHLPRFSAGFDVTLHEDLVDKPTRWKKPRRVFVCSKGDLFHESVPWSFTARVFDAMWAAHMITAIGDDSVFVVLTKRPRIMRAFLNWYEHEGSRHRWPRDFPHVHIGVSVEDRERARERLPLLHSTPAAHRIVSLEPLLEDVTNDLRTWISSLDWIVVGGLRAPVREGVTWSDDWARGPRDLALEHGLDFMFKQRAGANPEQLPELDGVVWDGGPTPSFSSSPNASA